MRRSLFLLIALTSFAFAPAQAQELTVPCWWRDTDLSQPWISADIPCLEEVINDPALGELAFTALAAAPDGSLYAARPLAGEIWRLVDTNDDWLPDTPRLAADGLTLPNGLAYAGDVLYISGGANLYRLRDGEIDVLVDDLPAGLGFWNGGVAVGPDDRIYVGIGAPCDACVPDDPERGAILSFALDGSDRQVVASGLRNPADLAFLDGELWVIDSARDGLFNQPDLDEINRVEVGAHFGWPHCVGADNQPDIDGFGCAAATAPVVSLPTGSTPIGLAAYESDTIPSLTGTLLVALSGSYNQIELRGYTVASATVTGDALSYRPIMPAQPEPNTPFTLDEINYRGSGVWPHRPYDVTVNTWGWIYISLGGGRILAIRPEAEEGG